MSTTEDEPLVFGYACKLFRDDEKALQVENGDLLVEIDGMKIDRFDGRGILPDLKSFESTPESTELKREDYMSSEDVLVEEMCDDERYKAMKIADEAEQRIKKEEAMKRAEAEGAEIGFDYDNPEKKQVTENTAPAPEISLHQLAALIEKTSEFIATQGAQMSILMRAKEAHNPKFQFLNPGNPYNPIYIQVLEKKKARVAGRLPSSNVPEVPSIEEVEQLLRDKQNNLPSAAPGQSPTTVGSNPKSAYSQLVKKMQVHLPPPPPPPPAQPPTNQNETKESKPTIEDTTNKQGAAVATPGEDNVVMVQVPPYDDQALIDQTASYVVRNGGEKLGILRKRMPEKFAFLRSDHKYNTYYQFKVTLYHEMRTERHREQKAKAVANANAAAAALQDPSKSFPLLKGFFR